MLEYIVSQKAILWRASRRALWPETSRSSDLEIVDSSPCYSVASLSINQLSNRLSFPFIEDVHG